MKLETRNSKLETWTSKFGTQFLVSLLLGVGGPALAAPLQFTNISTALLPGLTNRLAAVAYDGNTNFVAVGDRAAYVRGFFTPNQPFLALQNWSSGSVVSGGPNLLGVASSGSLFVASGISNLVFSSANGAGWSSNYHIFPNTATAAALAYNGGNFVGVAKAPQISYVASPPPNGTNWTAATITNLSFVESFRAVTPRGANGFAASGIFGVVRLSSDAGTNWQAGLSGVIGQPDLLGIAAAGSLLVCVGDANPTAPGGTNGVILVSTNNGVNWVVAYTNSATGTPLNGTAYTGVGFVAAGRSGVILTSPDGTVWTPVPADAWRGATPTTADLYGVTFATSGFMNQVGVLVGANGTVILAGPPPPAPVAITNTYFNCAGYGNPPLQVSVTNSVGTNMVTVDWYDAATGGNQLTNASVSYTPPTQMANVNSTNSYWAEARDLRTGFVSTNRTPVTLIIHQRPTAEIISTNSVCNGQTSVVTVKFKTGNPPWLLTFTDGVNNYIVPANSATLNYVADFTVSPTNVFLNEATNWIYYLTALSDSFCAADTNNFPSDLAGRGQVTVYPRPTATVTGTTAICNGGSTDVHAALTGIGPWNVTWSSNGVVVATHTGVSSTTDTYTVSPTNTLLNASVTAAYTVTALTDAHCTANPGDLSGSAVITVNPRPTTTLVSVDRTNCNDGSAYTIIANLTGLGPWTVTWWDGAVSNVVASPATRTVAPTNTLANAPVFYFYWVEALSDANCSAFRPWGDFVGTNAVRVNPRPTSTLTSLDRTNCNDGSAYVIQAALTGLGPWAVTWWDGAVSNVAASPASRTVYPTNVLANAETNYFYWVQALADTNCTANQPGDLSGTNAVRINPRPTATLVSLDRTNCNDGSAYTIQADLTGIGPWNVTWYDGAVSNVVASPATRVVYPTNVLANAATNLFYWVQGLTDAYCTANQPGDLTGTNVVRVNPRPTTILASLNRTNCNDGSAYTIQANLTGLGPWTVTWWDGAVSNVVASPATRTVYPTNELPNAPAIYTFWVEDLADMNCSASRAWGDFTGTNIVRVNPRPTLKLVSLDETRCNDGSAYTVQAVLTGLGPWAVTWWDGAVSNVVASPALRTVYPTNELANAATNRYYWVQALQDTSTSCTANQPGDLRGTNTVLVNPRPTATLVTTNSICNGQSTDLHAILTGLGPWTVWWSDGTVQTTNAAPGSSATLVYTVSPANPLPNDATNHYYWVTAVSNATTCTALASDIRGTNRVTVNPRPTATLATTNTICNGQSTVLQVNLTGLGPWTVWWADGATQTTNVAAGNPVTLTRTVSPANPLPNAATNFFYWVTTVSNATTCLANQPGDIQGTNEVIVNPRPTATLVSADQTVCYNSPATLQVNLTGLGPWTLTWSDGSSQTTNASPAIYQPTPTNPSANGTTNYVYTVTQVADPTSCTNLPGDLQGTTHVTVMPHLQAWSFTVGTNDDFSTNLCNGSTTLLRVRVTGVASRTLKWTDGYVTNTVSADTNTFDIAITPVNSLVDQSTNYTYSVVELSDTNGCLGDLPTNNVAVTVYARPTATLTGDTNLCTAGTALIHANLTGLAPWTNVWTVITNGTTNTITRTVTTNYDDLTILLTNGTQFTVITNLFSVSVTDAASTNGCAPFQSRDVVAVVYPRLSVGITHTNVAIQTNGSFTIVAALTGTPGWTLEWSDGFVQTTNASPATRVIAGTDVVALGGAFDYWVTNLVDGSSNGCPADLGTNVTTITVVPSGAPFIVSGNDTNCLGGCSTIQVLLTWQTNTSPRRIYGAPWTVYWSDGVTSNYTTSPGTRLVCPGATTNYSVTQVTASGYRYDMDPSPSLNYFPPSSIIGSATITIRPLPSASVTTTNHVICSNDTMLIEVSLAGASPWNLAWSDGVSQSSVTNNPAFRVVSPTNTFTYAVTNLTDANGCSATNLTGSATITVTNCAPLAIALGAEVPPTNAVLTWGGNRWLRSAPTFTDPWTNVTQGTLWTTNYWTNPISASQEFFRLGAPTNGP